MNNFKKQIKEQMELYQMQLQDDVKRLVWMMERLNIHDEFTLNTALEFAELFSRLKNDGVIQKLSDNTP